MAQVHNAALKICILLLGVIGSLDAFAQVSTQADSTVDPRTRVEVIETAIRQLNEQYIFPETAKEIERSLRERLKNKEFDGVTSAKQLAKMLTAIMQDISRDQHLSVNFSAEPMPVKAKKSGPTPEEREGRRNYGEAINFGFEKVERLPANIGYIRLNLFFPVEYGAETAVAAMALIAHTDALIIDLRGNDGGHPDMNSLLATYLFAEPVHIGGVYHREGNMTKQFWTLPFVPGKRYVGKDVYILTSKRTFSSAEAFAYDLKALKRATVIGETTGGGANPRDVVRINEHFWIGLPTARAVNPITQTNWEGTGVTPDIAVPADLALKTAQLTALRKFVATTTEQTRIRNLTKLIATLQEELDELSKKK